MSQSQGHLPTRSGSAFREEFGNDGDVVFDSRHRYQASTTSNVSAEAQGLLQNREDQPKFSDDVMGEVDRRHARASNAHSLATTASEYPPTVSSRGALLANTNEGGAGYNEGLPASPNDSPTQPLMKGAGSPQQTRTSPMALSTTNPDPQ